MTLADDDRARVPFALIGVVLLVGSATLSAGLAERSVGPTRPTTDRAFDRATVAARTTLAAAVRSAGRRAAQEPITERAETPYGRVLNESAPFRDALRVRIYLAARRGFDGIDVRTDGLRARVSLPPVSNATTLRRAKRRVELTRVEGEGEAVIRLRVRVAAITTTARRDGELVDAETRPMTVVVTTPVLALHDRVSAYESRLNRGPLEPGPGAGLGLRLSARLYPIAWTRGYAQYGGAPIENVVANRHVAFAANGGVLGVQRSVFGRSDAAGRAAISDAGRRVALSDLRAGAGLPDPREIGPIPEPSGERSMARSNRSALWRPTPEDDLRVGINRTADAAFRDLVRGFESPTLASISESVYAAEATLVVRTRIERDEPRPRSRPGAGWSRVGRTVETETVVEALASDPPAVSSNRTVTESHARLVERRHTAVERWQRGNETRRIVTTWRDRYRVDLAVAVRPAPTAYAPSRPIETVYERGGPLDGPNMADVPSTARRRLLVAAGGVDALARRAVSGSIGVRHVRLEARRPTGLETWLYTDLAAFRERVRDVSTALARGGVGRANPAARLADALRSRRAALVGAPPGYGSVAAKARTAARAAFLDRVLDRLDARAARNDRLRREMDEAMADADAGSFSRSDRIRRARSRVARRSRRGLSTGGPTGSLDLFVDGEPSYLTLAAGGGRHAGVRGTEPAGASLAARNVNLFTTPYGDVADAVVGAVAGDRRTARVDLHTAAVVLRGANRTLRRGDDPALERRRDRLRRDLHESMTDLRGELRADLRREPLDLDAGDRRAAVDAAFDRWETTANRALAATNGSAARALAVEIERRSPVVRRSERARDWAGVRTRLSMDEAVSATTVTVPEESVNRTATATRRLSRRLATKALGGGVANLSERARSRYFGETLGAIPSGLPVAPVPGYWYATVNVWRVTVRGSYAEFTVRAAYGTPATPGATTAYTRSNGTVSVDVDGDGAPERLGRTTRLSFETSTSVIVVVPPNGRGVGDTDGNADERSPGWSTEE